MKNKLITITLCLALLCLIFSGCQNMQEGQDKVFKFSLDDAVMVERGIEIPLPLDGILGIPDEDHAPVIFILHGTHPVEDAKQDEYYSGFSYLVHDLSKAGFFPVAINVNQVFMTNPIEGDAFFRLNTIFSQYYSALKRANEGEKIFGVDLTGKMNLTKLNFIGHSRGGNSSLYLAKQLKEQGQFVQSVLMVAPSLFFDINETYTDLPMGIIVPQYDGDVVGLDGYLFYNHAVTDKTREGLVSVAFLHGGNHGWFNSKLGEDTLFKYENSDYIDPDTQRSFLSAYAIDFLRLYNFNDGNFVDTLGDEFVTRHKISAVMTLYSPKSINLVDADKALSASDGMTANPVVESLAPQQDSAGAFTIPVMWEEPLSLMSLTWNASGARAFVEFDEQDQEPSQFLLFTLALDSSRCREAILNIVVTDKNGSHVTRQISSTNTQALRYYDGQVLTEDLESPMWSVYTPLGTYAMNVSQLDSNIVSIELTGGSDQGAIMLKSIQSLSKE